MSLKCAYQSDRLDKLGGFSYDSSVQLNSVFPLEIELFWYLMQRDEQDLNSVECDNRIRSWS